MGGVVVPQYDAWSLMTTPDSCEQCTAVLAAMRTLQEENAALAAELRRTLLTANVAMELEDELEAQSRLLEAEQQRVQVLKAALVTAEARAEALEMEVEELCDTLDGQHADGAIGAPRPSRQAAAVGSHATANSRAVACALERSARTFVMARYYNTWRNCRRPCRAPSVGVANSVSTLARDGH
jgi:hypothetical protein